MIEVRYEDHMGDDLRVVNAARQSFDARHSEWSETPRTKRGRSDSELIVDLANDEHTLPFRHPQITLSGTAPLPVARQLEKHQVGFSWSEISRRYKTTNVTCHKIADWRAAPAEKRQGSGESLPEDVQNTLSAIQWRNIEMCLAQYNEALRMGATPEQARFMLPQSMDVRWTWTGSLLGFWMVVKSRSHPDVQAETREFAQGIAAIVEPLFPRAWLALNATLEPSPSVRS